MCQMYIGFWHSRFPHLSCQLHHFDTVICSVWDTRSQQVVKTLETGNTVLSLELIDDGNMFLTADGHDVKLWDANTFTVIKSFTFPYNVESASYSPAKQKLAWGGEDMWVHLHDFATGQEIDCNKGDFCCHLSAVASLKLLPAVLCDYEQSRLCRAAHAQHAHMLDS